MKEGLRRFRLTLRLLMLVVVAASLLLVTARDSIRGWLWPPTFPVTNTRAATERARRAALGLGPPKAGPGIRPTGDPLFILPGLP
jgi:hypothetical protein